MCIRDRYAAPLPFLDLICVGTATQTEVTEQIDLVYSLIHQQFHAIGLVPIDSKALDHPAVEAVRKGIPVINIDIQLVAQLLEQAGVEVAFVGTATQTEVEEQVDLMYSLIHQQVDAIVLDVYKRQVKYSRRRIGRYSPRQSIDRC